MDWNWFFSSLSQSAAAIVGIFGAFIVSKTLGNQTSFISKSIQLQTMIADCENITAEAKDLYFKWYNEKSRILALDKLSSLIDEDPSILEQTPDTLLEQLNFSDYDNKEQVLTLISNNIAQYKAKLEQYKLDLAQAEQEKNRISDLSNQGGNDIFSAMSRGMAGIAGYNLHQSWPTPPSASPIDSIISKQSLYAIRPELDRELERIESVRRKAAHQVKLNLNFSKAIQGNPERSGYIAITLALITVLFFAGVIYPVSFMPLMTGQTPSISINAVIPTLLSFKGIMLTIISSIFCAIPAIFLHLNNSFRYNEDQVQTLKRHCTINEYSKYFAYYEVNTTTNTKIHNVYEERSDE